MSKIKIYELAKEIGATSKEVMDFLAGKDMGVKSHMNSIEDTEANQELFLQERKRRKAGGETSGKAGGKDAGEERGCAEEKDCPCASPSEYAERSASGGETPGRQAA